MLIYIIPIYSDIYSGESYLTEQEICYNLWFERWIIITVHTKHLPFTFFFTLAESNNSLFVVDYSY
jgi:hypothetical protein